MDNDNFEHLLGLVGENFYVHIEEKFGKNVEKVLRFHDIDSFTLLGEVDEPQLINIFEKPNEATSSSELIQLKYDICNIFEESVSMKIGTKSKLIVLLKLTKHILKKKNHQIMQQKRLNRTNKHRSTSSSSNSSATDLEISHIEYHSYINQSIEKLLQITQNNIHGINDTNISASNFQVIIENSDDCPTPNCFIKCICGERIKLYLKNNRFQLSNLQKHFSVKKTKFPVVIDIRSQQTERPEHSSQSGVNNETQSTPSIIQSTLSNSIYMENDNLDKSASTTVKKAQKPKSSARLGDGKRDNVPIKSMKNKQNGRSISQVLPKPGETQSSIEVIPPSKLNKQPLNNETGQTNNLPPSSLYPKSVKEQNLNLHKHSESKKRKAADNDGEVEISSVKKSTKKPNTSFSVSDKISDTDILSTLLNTINLNSERSSNHYRYCSTILRFATCLFILSGAYVYEYIRINFKYLLPSIQTVTNFYTCNSYEEGKFRYEESKSYLDSIESNIVFVSEDCSAIIPRVEYNSITNTFNGFATQIIDGKPVENYFQCSTFEELKYMFETIPRATQVNVHMIQPICNKEFHRAPLASILAAYGTDNKITSIDILKRWVHIYQEFRCRGIRVLGFSTDGDPKFLRSMRLSSNFFIRAETLNIPNENLYFTIKIPLNWSWFFLNPNQLFLFMQDGIHLCTKIRNRLLSSKTKLKMGSYEGSIRHLEELIKLNNKIDHNLSKSDLNVHDKQNFCSCQKISDDKVLNILFLNKRYKATYNYLLLLNLLIKSYTQQKIPLLDRIYYAFIVLFYVRLWRIWLFITKRTRKLSTQKSNNKEKFNHFITSNALLCIELNSHYLLYTYLLIKEKIIPPSIAQSIHLFSSQDCENVFRDARALSGVYSTRINFTMKQFLKRIDKLNALTELKQFESNNDNGRIIFPIHHKIKQHMLSSEINITEQEPEYSLINVETTILEAYKVAQQMSISVGMDIKLLKKNLFDIEESSKMAKQLLKLNILTESEILTIDDSSGKGDMDEEEEEDADEKTECQGDDQEENDQEENDQEDGDREENDQEGGDREDDDREENDQEGGDREDGFEAKEDHDGAEEADIIDEDYIEDSAEEGDIEDSVDENINDESCDSIYDYNSSVQNEEPTITFENIQTTSFSGLRLLKSVPLSNLKKYFPIVIHNKKMFLHKSTATWYLQDKQSRLPCDRLQRVQFRKKTC